MNKDFRSLKLKLWLHIMLVTAVMLAVITMVYYLCVNVIFRESLIVFTLKLHAEYGIDLYSYAILHKTDILLVILAVGITVSIYLALNRFTYYIDIISDGVHQVFSNQNNPIVLPQELKDIETNLNTIRYDLKQKELEAKLSEEQKNDLIVYLAHDLKTPLTSIIGYLSLIEESKHLMTENEKDQFSHIAYEKSLRLKILVEELFEIARFNAKNIPLMRRQLPLHYLLSQLSEEFYPLLQEKHLSCIIECKENIMLTADGDQLSRVFDNILRNAICYSDPKTEIKITVNETPEEITLAFINHGLIISEDQLEHIFDKFYRVDEARASNSGGAGLGLAIAKIIVELHGGTIRATSDAESTCFLLRFPKERRA
ncbi:MAG: sensor histidine kinase [Bacillota bacterium]